MIYLYFNAYREIGRKLYPKGGVGEFPDAFQASADAEIASGSARTATTGERDIYLAAVVQMNSIRLPAVIDRDGNAIIDGDVLLQPGKTVRVNGVDVVGIPKVYRALLSQSGTNAPIATILENTLGGIPVWTRGSAGGFVATLAEAFPEGKTFFEANTVDRGLQVGDEVFMLPGWGTENEVTVSIMDVNLAGIDGLGRGYLSILVYP